MIDVNERDYYTLSEISDRTGVVRQKFQVWRSFGLLIPLNEKDIREKEEQNRNKRYDEKQVRVPNWLYPKGAVYTVFIIQMLLDIGYKHKEIKEIFEKNKLEDALKSAQDTINHKIEELTNQKTFISYIFEKEACISELSENLKNYYWKKYIKITPSNVKIVPFKKKAKLISFTIQNNESDDIPPKYIAMMELLFSMLLTMHDEPTDSIYIEECLKAIFQVTYDTLVSDTDEEDVEEEMIIMKYWITKSFQYFFNNISFQENLYEYYIELIATFGSESLTFVTG